MKVLKYQHWHFIILTALLIGIYFLVIQDTTMLNGKFIGISSKKWFLLAILSPIIHQVYVVVCWRLELFYSVISKTFGNKGFKLFKFGFTILILLRILTIILLAISSSNTLNLNKPLAYILSGILFIPSVYLFYSVKKYFGIDRAFGIDHFEPKKFKELPFIRKGIFKYTSNGMYVFGFLILWIPGIIFLSKAALLVALFNHTYIWIHYYFTELPDIKIIYED